MVRVQLVNPLPTALLHYERELVEALESLQLDVNVVPSISAEMEGINIAGKAARAGRLISSRWKRDAGEDISLVTWPVFGYADPLTWRRAKQRVWLVVHDPVPLRRQVGMGRLAALGGRQMRHVGIIVHSTAAAVAIEALGWHPRLLPHPMLRPTREAVQRILGPEAPVTVVGQWKPARDLTPLEVLAHVPKWEGRRRIYGRSWPEVEGWNVEAEFHTESAIDAAISGATCVLLPYDHYFQSGIAVRCLERLTPVVGRTHPFLTELFGADWPGTVRHEDWAAAIERAEMVPIDFLVALRERYWQACIGRWRDFAEVLANGVCT